MINEKKNLSSTTEAYFSLSLVVRYLSLTVNFERHLLVAPKDILYS